MEKECVAMLLAGGEGKRLGVLTKKKAKPALTFGGRYRIIDFSLSNCANSGIETVGVLTQYKPLLLNTHIGDGAPWGMDKRWCGVRILPPFVRENGGSWYKGTANAVYQNLSFIEMYKPSYVLVLSGDHIYKMDYSKMLSFHREKNAELTIAVMEVPWEEAGRFGIMSTGSDGRVMGFAEKPQLPKSNLASMGVYFFSTDILKKYLQKDEDKPLSSNDFGKDIIPLMLKERCRLFAYPFQGYWKDVGTVESFWEANMELLNGKNGLDIFDPGWCIYTVNQNRQPNYLSPGSKVKNTLLNGGCVIFGKVVNSVLAGGVFIGEGSVVKNSVIMENVRIGHNVKINNAIIDERTVVEDGARIRNMNGSQKDIILVEEGMTIPGDSAIAGFSYREEYKCI